MTNILIPFYSSFGHVYKLAKAVQEGSQSLPDTKVKLRLFPEIDVLKKDNDDMGGADFYAQARTEMGGYPRRDPGRPALGGRRHLGHADALRQHVYADEGVY